MEPISLAVLGVTATLIMLMLRVPIAFSLGLTACVGLILRFGWQPGREIDIEAGMRPALSIIGSSAYNFVANYPLSMIPLFIALGHVAYYGGITTDLYAVLNRLLRRLPGGLALASLTGCAGFSAITGSSVACAAAMGRIAVPEMLRYGYDPRLAAGSVAAGGTLGSLIPPSLLFVIYSIFAEHSVRDLFVAGILPGLLSFAGYAITILVWCALRPQSAPRAPAAATEDGYVHPMRDLVSLWPIVLLMTIVVGGIYEGYFTPTEAAAVSLLTAAIIGFSRRRLSIADLASALKTTVQQTAMIFAVALAAKVFVSFISLTQVIPVVLDWIEASGAPMVLVLAGVVLLYLVIGMFLDSIGILVLTLPFTLPLVESYGLGLVWFGVVVVKLLEIGLITPPIGLNVFVIKSVSPMEVTLGRVFQGVSWFLLLDFVVLGLILAFPVISTVLLG